MPIDKFKLPVWLTYRWLDLLLFKISWAALVIFQEKALMPALGIIALKIVTWPEISRFLPIVLLTIILGISLDIMLTLGGLFVFPDSFLPLWLIVLWISFALTLPRGFAFLALAHPLWQACAGVAACFGYLAGWFMEAVSFGLPVPVTMTILAMLWAILLPMIFSLEKRFLKIGANL